MLGQLRALRWARGTSEVVHGPENFRGSWSYPLLEGAVAESVLFWFFNHQTLLPPNESALAVQTPGLHREK